MNNANGQITWYRGGGERGNRRKALVRGDLNTFILSDGGSARGRAVIFDIFNKYRFFEFVPLSSNKFCAVFSRYFSFFFHFFPT